MKGFILFFFLLSSHLIHANDLEGIIGANYTSYEDSNETRAGIGAKLKYNWYNSGAGFFVQGLFRGISIANVDSVVGYGYKSSGSSFYEVGAGLAFNPFFGSGFGALLGVGTQLGDGWYVNMLTVYFGGGLNHLTVTPMIGIRL